MQLRNGLLELEFDDRNGNLRQIRNLQNGQRWLNDTRGFRLFKLIVPTPEHNSRPLFSHTADRPALRLRGDTLTIRFPELRDRATPTGIAATVRVRLPAGSSEAFFSIAIENRSPHRIHEMWFPWIGGRTAPAGASADRLTTSKHRQFDVNGRLAKDALSTHAFGRHQQRWAEDPLCMLPMADFSNGSGGLSYNKYERRPSPHVLVFENAVTSRAEVCLSWAWATGIFVEPGQTWTSCEFGVGVHAGDWHATADRFRDWLKTWWQPAPTPPAVRAKIGLYHVQIHGFSGERYREFAELPALARDCRRYGVADMSFWDCVASIYYRPDLGGFWEMPRARRAELKRALAAVRRLDCTINACVNWRLLAKSNSQWRRLRPAIQQSLFGEGIYGFPPGTMDGGWYNEPGYEMGSFALCQGSRQFRKFADALLESTLALGFDSVFVDQASEWNYCLSRRHGHASPWEAWEQTYAWYAHVARRTRARHPGGYVLAELQDLYNTQYFDLWWNWSWRDGLWSVPEVFRYVLPSMIPCWCIDEHQRDAIADAFATGSFMALATCDMTGRLSDAPALARQVKRLADLRRATAAAVNQARFRDTVGLTVQGGRGYAYTSDRTLAVTLANALPRRATLAVALQPSALGMRAPASGVLHVEGQRPRTVALRRRGGAQHLQVVLPAFGAGVLTMDGVCP